MPYFLRPMPHASSSRRVQRILLSQWIFWNWTSRQHRIYALTPFMMHSSFCCMPQSLTLQHTKTIIMPLSLHPRLSVYSRAVLKMSPVSECLRQWRSMSHHMRKMRRFLTIASNQLVWKLRRTRSIWWGICTLGLEINWPLHMCMVTEGFEAKTWMHINAVTFFKKNSVDSMLWLQSKTLSTPSIMVLVQALGWYMPSTFLAVKDYMLQLSREPFITIFKKDSCTSQRLISGISSASLEMLILWGTLELALAMSYLLWRLLLWMDMHLLLLLWSIENNLEGLKMMFSFSQFSLIMIFWSISMLKVRSSLGTSVSWNTLSRCYSITLLEVEALIIHRKYSRIYRVFLVSGQMTFGMSEVLIFHFSIYIWYCFLGISLQSTAGSLTLLERRMDSYRLIS